MKEELKRLDDFKSYDVRCAFHNINGGVRKDIAKGDITFGTVYESFPFDNEIVIVKVSGKTLWTSFYNNKNNTAIWHNFSNAATEIDDNKEYYLITTDFLLTNKDYYGTLFDRDEILETVYTNVAVRDAVTNQVKISSPIDAAKFKSTVKEFKR